MYPIHSNKKYIYITIYDLVSIASNITKYQLGGSYGILFFTTS